ncbi:MAG: hypothetical protein JW904_12665 [Spirochaetales bacterium]|nr:hypothetical protein [Spirochaetales bacterium]
MKIQSLIDSLHDIHSKSIFPFVIFDDTYKIITVNEAFSRLFSSHTAGNNGKRLDFLMIKDKEPFESISTLTKDQICRFSGVIFCVKEGLECNFCMTVFPVSTKPDNMYFYAIFKDTSDIEQNIVEKSLYALIKASLLKDNDTGNHIKRVNEYSRIIAAHILKTRPAKYPDVNHFFINKIAYVAAMHDVGKNRHARFYLDQAGAADIG